MGELVKALAGIFDNYGFIAGLLVVLILVLCFLSYKILKYFFAQNEKILNMAMDMNTKWQKVIDDMTSNNREFFNQSREAHNYQRQEHKEMITSLEVINLNAKIRHEVLSKICDNLDKQGKVLVRINGYKDSG
jgi:uncharacterized protein (DUF2267 family)